MFRTLFLLFLIVPVIEISILLQLSDVIGGWSTILLVIFTAYLGAKMVKQQGLQAIAQIQQKAASGQIPGEELFNGVCILISGVLLLTPGILTDVLGFLLLTPVVRSKMATALKQKMHLFVAGSQQGQPFSFTSSQFTSEQDNKDSNANQGYIIDHNRHEDEGSHSSDTNPSGSNDVIDGEFQRKD
jgi:UPF0716 protein FxsA